MHSLNGTMKTIEALRKALEPYAKLRLIREGPWLTLKWGKKTVKKIPAAYYDKL